MSHDRNTVLSYSEKKPRLHAGFCESVLYTAVMLVAVIALAPLVMLWPKRKSD